MNAGPMTRWWNTPPLSYASLYSSMTRVSAMKSAARGVRKRKARAESGAAEGIARRASSGLGARESDRTHIQRKWT